MPPPAGSLPAAYGIGMMEPSRLEEFPMTAGSPDQDRPGVHSIDQFTR